MRTDDRGRLSVEGGRVSNRHSRDESRKPREYVAWFFRTVREVPGYASAFYGGIVLVILGVIISLIQ